MKSFLLFVLTIIILSACKSESNVKTYNNGKYIARIVTNDNINGTVIDTINVAELREPLKVLVEKDTIWFDASTISRFIVSENTQLNVYFVPKDDKDDTIDLEVKPSDKRDYYAVMNFGKFFDINNIKEINFCILEISNESPSNSIKLVVQEVQYDLDLEQFKQ